MKYLKFTFPIIILFITFIAIVPVQAQTIPKNVNVDQYSDAQIMQVLQQAQSRGMSDAQVVQQAQAQGLPADQVSRLQERIAGIRKKQGNSNPADSTQSAIRHLNYRPDSTENINGQRDNKIDVLGALKPKIFGADLFRNSNISSKCLIILLFRIISICLNEPLSFGPPAAPKALNAVANEGNV